MDMDVKKIEEALGGISAQIKEQGKEILAKATEMTAEQKERVDGMLLKQGELQEALREVQQKQARGEQAGPMHAKSWGEQAAEAPEIKSLYESIRSGRKADISISVKAITTTSMGGSVNPDRQTDIRTLPNRRMTVRDLLAPGSTDSNSIIYPKETGFTNNAAPVAEGTAKPESTLTLTTVTESVKKIATYMKASTEILADLPALRSLIDFRLRYMLAFREEAQLLMGTGVGQNLNGLYTQATAFVAPAGAVAAATAIDRLRIALLQAELAEFPSDGIVLHPTDWANMELLKDGEGRYLIGNPQGTLSPTLWNRNVVATQAMTQGNFLAGAFRLAAQIFDREDANIVVATENQDDFVMNLVTILIEERLALAVYRPEALVKGALAVA